MSGAQSKAEVLVDLPHGQCRDVHCKQSDYLAASLGKYVLFLHRRWCSTSRHYRDALFLTYSLCSQLGTTNGLSTLVAWPCGAMSIYLDQSLTLTSCEPCTSSGTLSSCGARQPSSFFGSFRRLSCCTSAKLFNSDTRMFAHCNFAGMWWHQSVAVLKWFNCKCVERSIVCWQLRIRGLGVQSSTIHHRATLPVCVSLYAGAPVRGTVSSAVVGQGDLQVRFILEDLSLRFRFCLTIQYLLALAADSGRSSSLWH